jgi:hypothetical protein
MVHLELVTTWKPENSILLKKYPQILFNIFIIKNTLNDIIIYYL